MGWRASLCSCAGLEGRFPGSCHSPLSPFLDLSTPPFHELRAVVPSSACASPDRNCPICACASRGGEDCLFLLARGTRLNHLTLLIPFFLIVSCDYAPLRAQRGEERNRSRCDPQCQLPLEKRLPRVTPLARARHAAATVTSSFGNISQLRCAVIALPVPTSRLLSYTHTISP